MSLAARVNPLIVIETRESFSTSENRKSDTANVFAVSSFVVTLLTRATGASLTALTLIFIVAATVPLPSSFALKENEPLAAPFAFAAGV